MIYLLGIIGTLAAVCAVSAAVCSIAIKTIYYKVRLPGASRKVRTVLIADLHSREFGPGNAKLLAKLRDIAPEYIFACGDIIGRDVQEPDIRRMLRFLEECSRTAPTCFVRGNHETGLLFSDHPDLLERISKNCTVVNDSSTEIELGGQRISLGGTKGSFGYLDEPDGQSFPMLAAMCRTGLPMIVMSHKPDAVISSAFAKSSGALFLSGHTHGGLWRIPFAGGLAAPGQGLLPKYDMGMFEFENNTKLIITSGMHGYWFIPRLFNLPEITVIDFEP